MIKVKPMLWNLKTNSVFVTNSGHRLMKITLKKNVVRFEKDGFFSLFAEL